MSTTEGGAHRRTFGEHDVRLPTLLFAFLGAPIAWTLHFLLIYFLDTLFCTTAAGGVDVVIYVATVAFALVSFASGLLAHRLWRRRAGAQQSLLAALTEPTDRITSLLVLGIGASSVFTLLIVFEGLAPLWVPPCSEFVP